MSHYLCGLLGPADHRDTRNGKILVIISMFLQDVLLQMKRPLLTKHLSNSRVQRPSEENTLLSWQWQDLCKLLLIPNFQFSLQLSHLSLTSKTWNFLQNRQQNQPLITSNVTEFFNIGVSKTGVLPISSLSLKVQIIKSQLTPSLLIKATAGLRRRLCPC